MSTTSEENTVNGENPVNTTEYDANFDGVISYSERAGLISHEDGVVEDDVELGENGFEEVQDEDDFEDVPAYSGSEEVEPAVSGVPDGAEEAEQELLPVEEEDNEDEGFLEEIIDESALPEHVKEILNMDVGEALHAFFHHDNK